MSIHDIYLKAAKLRSHEKIEIIFIDNLNLIYSENKELNIYEKYALLSKFIKRLNRDLQIPIVVNVDVSDLAVSKKRFTLKKRNSAWKGT